MTTDIKRDSFETELVALQDNLFSFALTLTSDTSRAEDLRQDTTLKVLTNRDKFKENTNFKGWVFTVMRNLFINDYHRLTRGRSIFDTSADLTYMGEEEESEGYIAPDNEMDLQEITQAIDSLTDEYKLPFSMYTAGFKYKEIADELSLPIGTVKSRIFFARKKLQDTLVDYDPR